MRIYEIATNQYPNNVSSNWIVNYVANLNDREDPYEGEIPDHILEFNRYRLEKLPISNTNALHHNFDPTLASEYSKMLSDTSPPIVFDPTNKEIIDGFYRVRAAMIRGNKTIMAYVGY